MTMHFQVFQNNQTRGEFTQYNPRFELFKCDDNQKKNINLDPWAALVVSIIQYVAWRPYRVLVVVERVVVGERLSGGDGTSRWVQGEILQGYLGARREVLHVGELTLNCGTVWYENNVLF